MKLPLAPLLLTGMALGTGCVPTTSTDPPAADAFAGLEDLDGETVAPLTGSPPASLFLFVRSDCPIANRYAPEMQHLHERFAARGVEFWLVYPDPDEAREAILTHLEQYGHPGRAVRDPRHEFVARTEATVTPEAAVFDAEGEMVYRGRIDDRFVDFGKARASATQHDLADALEETLAGRPVATPRTKAIGCFIPALAPPESAE